MIFDNNLFADLTHSSKFGSFVFRRVRTLNLCTRMYVASVGGKPLFLTSRSVK